MVRPGCVLKLFNFSRFVILAILGNKNLVLLTYKQDIKNMKFGTVSHICYVLQVTSYVCLPCIV